MKLRYKLCRGKLRYMCDQQDDRWYTNGHWMIRANRVRLEKSAAKILDPYVMDQNIILPPPERYRQATLDRTWDLCHRYALIVKDEIVTWIDIFYANALIPDTEAGDLYAAGEYDPILVGGRTLNDAWTIIAPTRAPRRNILELKKWLNQQTWSGIGGCTFL